MQLLREVRCVFIFSTAQEGVGGLGRSFTPGEAEFNFELIIAAGWCEQGG